MFHGTGSLFGSTKAKDFGKSSFSISWSMKAGEFLSECEGRKFPWECEGREFLSECVGWRFLSECEGWRFLSECGGWKVLTPMGVQMVLSSLAGGRSLLCSYLSPGRCDPAASAPSPFLWADSRPRAPRTECPTWTSFCTFESRATLTRWPWYSPWPRIEVGLGACRRRAGTVHEKRSRVKYMYGSIIAIITRVALSFHQRADNSE